MVAMAIPLSDDLRAAVLVMLLMSTPVLYTCRHLVDLEGIVDELTDLRIARTRLARVESTDDRFHRLVVTAFQEKSNAPVATDL